MNKATGAGLSEKLKGIFKKDPIDFACPSFCGMLVHEGKIVPLRGVFEEYQRRQDMNPSEIQKLIDQLSTKKIDMFHKDFLLTWEKSRDELEATYLVADILREMRQANIDTKLWQNGIAVSNFRDKSTRTRFSYTSASDLLGLYVQDLDEGLADSVFDRYRDDTYREASYKPYIIAAMILLGKRKDPSATLKALLSRNAPRQVL